MSKKQRSREKNIIAPAVTITAAAIDENRADGDSRKTGIIVYLKSHWWAAALIALFSIGALAGGLKYLEEDAQRQLAANQSKPANNREQSFLNSFNPFLPDPTPTPQLSKEYIYAGSRLLAVEDAAANAAPPADLAVWRPSTGYWYVMGAGGIIQAAYQWGNSTDQAVPGDYDGDGKTDFAVFRESAGTWYVIKSSTGTDEYYNFGSANDKALAADFDGDGKTDAALYRPSNGYWYIRLSTTGSILYQQFGLSTDIPTPADFDGDGKADISVWRGSDATFYALKSTTGALHIVQYGSSGDKPVPADYDGDGLADPAVWRGSDNNWYIKQSSNNASVNYQFGNQSNDQPVPNDYDGDGKMDIAVWRFASGTTSEIGNWYIRNSSTGSTRTEHWGTAGDKPVPSLWRR